MTSTTSRVAQFISLALGLDALPVAEAACIKDFSQVGSAPLVDPVSFITLFFDSPEKELLDKTGDLTFTSCFGLFVNPTTVWSEYQTLQPGQGLTYYNPQKKIVSSVEVRQVNNFLVALASINRNCGLVVRLRPLRGSRLWSASPSWEWAVLRPLVLLTLVAVAALNRDLVAAGAICVLLLSQTVAVVKTMLDGKVPDAGDSADEETNIFFLSNNVTVMIKSSGDLFREVSSHIASKAHHSVASWRFFTTLIFLAGVVLVGSSGTNFKLAYVAMHAVQAMLIARASGRPIESETVNRAVWEVDPKEIVSVERRREAYVWASQKSAAGTEWLVDWNLAAGETLEYVENALAESSHPQSKAGAEVR